MHTLKLALLHTNIRHKEPQRNCETLLALIRQAAGQGARIVVTPEMAISGYSFAGRDDILPHTETENGPILSAIAKVVEESGIYLCIGLATRDQGSGILHNSALVFGPDGRILCRYRKINAESRWACPGDPTTDNTFATPWGRVGVLICSDSYHSLMSRVTALRGADLLLIPANWPPTGLVPQEIWRARALENGFTVAACNRTGVDMIMDCREASSSVFDGAGKTLLDDRWPQSRIFVVDLPLDAAERLNGQRRRQCLAARPVALAHDCYLNLAAIGDLTSFLQLPSVGRIPVNCLVPKRPMDDLLLQLTHAREETQEPAPTLHLLPAAIYGERVLIEFERFCATGEQAIILRQSGRGEDFFLVFKGPGAPQKFTVATVAGRDEHAPREFHHGTAKICLAPFSLLRHPEFCLVAAKRGCDLAIASEYHLTGDDLLLAGARTVENLALAVCAVNRAGIWIPPVGHQRWGEILARPGDVCRLDLDTEGTRKKRFQDRIDFLRLLTP